MLGDFKTTGQDAYPSYTVVSNRIIDFGSALRVLPFTGEGDDYQERKSHRS
jgi:hypothetical protein